MTIDNRLAIEYVSRAIDRLERGWIKGKTFNDTGSRCCAAGALQLSSGEIVPTLDADDLPEFYASRKRAVDVLESRARSQGYRSLIYFNDHPSTTKSDIINLFRAAEQELSQ